MFIGREAELRELRAFLDARRQAIAVVYGRRRIGKTALIAEALGPRPALHFEGIENRPKREQIAGFLFQLARQAPGVETGGIHTWRDAFGLLADVVKEHPSAIVLDEFQWMANYRRAIVADLKMVWDQYLSKVPRVSLVLCGSIASFMTERVVKSQALYGRTDLVIHLKGFKLRETRAMLARHGLDEVLEAQMLFGGIPQYLELLRGQASVRLAVDKLAFTDNGYFLDEYDRIFVSHFGKNPDYERIVRALAASPYGLFRSELAREAGVNEGGGLSKQLRELESAGFVASITPFDKPASSKLIRVLLADAYLRFYFAFIRPNARKIRSGAQKELFARISQTPRYRAWLGRSFEYVCMDHARRLSEILGFSGVDFDVGPFFRAPRAGRGGAQVDLLFSRADRVITLCEVKCSAAPIGTKVIAEVEQRAEVLQEHFPTRTIQRVLVVHGRPTDDLVRSGYFYRIVRAEELF